MALERTARNVFLCICDPFITYQNSNAACYKPNYLSYSDWDYYSISVILPLVLQNIQLLNKVIIVKLVITVVCTVQHVLILIKLQFTIEIYMF